MHWKGFISSSLVACVPIHCHTFNPNFIFIFIIIIIIIRTYIPAGLVVSGLSSHIPNGAEEILAMLERGNGNRTQHPTEANATSSRSHAVFQVSPRNVRS